MRPAALRRLPHTPDNARRRSQPLRRTHRRRDHAAPTSASSTPSAGIDAPRRHPRVPAARAGRTGRNPEWKDLLGLEYAFSKELCPWFRIKICLIGDVVVDAVLAYMHFGNTHSATAGRPGRKPPQKKLVAVLITSRLTARGGWFCG